MSILDTVELFNSLNDTDRDTLSLYCQERLLLTEEILFHEWDDAVALYIVKSGSLKAYKERSDWEVILWYITANELAGEMAFFDASSAKKRMASIRAVEDTLVLVIMDYAILELSKKHPEMYEKIVNIMIERKKNS